MEILRGLWIDLVLNRDVRTVRLLVLRGKPPLERAGACGAKRGEFRRGDIDRHAATKHSEPGEMKRHCSMSLDTDDLRDTIDRRTIQFMKQRQVSVEQVALGREVSPPQTVEPFEARAVQFSRYDEARSVGSHQPTAVILRTLV